MKIRKVDDKPMVIHTKEKAKIHAHEPKGAKIKGSNIYTVERGPKTIGAKVSDDKKKSYRKSTIHQSEPKNKGLSRFKRNLKESNISIKTKNTNLHIAGRTGALAAGAVTEQVEGGQEVSQAAYLAYESSRPVTGTASKGAALFRKKADDWRTSGVVAGSGTITHDGQSDVLVSFIDEYGDNLSTITIGEEDQDTAEETDPAMNLEDYVGLWEYQGENRWLRIHDDSTWEFAQDRFAVVFFDADAILLVQRDAFGVKNPADWTVEQVWCAGRKLK